MPQPTGAETVRAVFVGLALLVPFAPSVTAAADTPAFSKDTGPASASCDGVAKNSDAWRACVGAARRDMPDAELFYAGYWLAKSGRYAEALAYLSLARDRDERVLTYIGFATRKLGNIDGALPYYAEALKRNPDFAVARAYLGEAYLSKDEPHKAKAQLDEIARRCGTSCAPYVDLARHIAEFESRKG